MKKSIIALSACCSWLGLAQAAPSGDQSSAAYSITERGPHHRVWSKTVWEPTPAGQLAPRTHSYTEIATGMHYRDANGRWAESTEEIEAFSGGAVARHGQSKVIFASNLATPGAVDIETPDGKRLRGHVLGLTYFDTSSGSNVFITQIKGSQGVISGPGEVTYPDAFEQVSGSIRYTYRRSGLEQDVILDAEPPAPEEFGLDSA